MKKYIVNHINELVDKYNTRNPYEILQGEDVLVIHIPMVIEKDGVFLSLKSGKAVLIDDSLHQIKKEFVAAHELLHATIHDNKHAFVRKYNPFEKDNILEIEGNLFAVELLIDEEFFREHQGKSFKDLHDLTGMPEHMIAKKYEEILSAKNNFYN